jgi:REP element-mobilizing transposase RayT
MREWQSQSHVRWYCRYHGVIVPKCRRKAIYGVLRKQIGEYSNICVDNFEWSWWKVMRCLTMSTGV